MGVVSGRHPGSDSPEGAAAWSPAGGRRDPGAAAPGRRAGPLRASNANRMVRLAHLLRVLPGASAGIISTLHPGLRLSIQPVHDAWLSMKDSCIWFASRNMQIRSISNAAGWTSTSSSPSRQPRRLWPAGRDPRVGLAALSAVRTTSHQVIGWRPTSRNFTDGRGSNAMAERIPLTPQRNSFNQSMATTPLGRLQPQQHVPAPVAALPRA
jgi:hypothetical protein